jgi:hypothetical protein
LEHFQTVARLSRRDLGARNATDMMRDRGPNTARQRQTLAAVHDIDPCRTRRKPPFKPHVISGSAQRLRRSPARISRATKEPRDREGEQPQRAPTQSRASQSVTPLRNGDERHARSCTRKSVPGSCDKRSFPVNRRHAIDRDAARQGVAASAPATGDGAPRRKGDGRWIGPTGGTFGRGEAFVRMFDEA